MKYLDLKSDRKIGNLKNGQPINTEFANYVLDDVSLLKDIMI